MIQPKLNLISTLRDTIESFGGYNHNHRIDENEFYDMKNLTGDTYPILSPRKSRGIYPFVEGTSDNNPTGLISKDVLCYVDGKYFVINQHRIDMNLSTEADACPKQLVSMGAYVIIMPDKKYINTADLSDYGEIEATYTLAENNVLTYSLCKIDGASYGTITSSLSAPQSANNGMLWLDISSQPHILKQYSETSEMWVQIPTTYIKISAPNIAVNFKQYDGVKISGINSEIPLKDTLNDKISIIQESYHYEPGVSEDKGTEDFIIVIGMIDLTSTQTGTAENSFCINRFMPKLDFVIESNNRLWGCRYGTDINGNIVNEIYASKQGDFKNWNCFMGISTDSYVVSCGTDGQWTGAVNHLGYPIFFKENCLHKIFGNYPANYQVQTTECRGVQKGAGNSMAIVNEKLFYKARNGVCCYDGSLPVEISRAFGDVHYSAIDETMNSEWGVLRNGAVAGTINNKYYITMKSEVDNNWYLFAYDVSLGLWHKNDEIRATAFCNNRNELYFIDCTTNTIKTIYGSGIEDVNAVEWFAESGPIGLSLPDKKYISRILMRVALNVGSKISIHIQYDSNNIWVPVYSGVGVNMRSFSIPIKPRRCDHFKLKFSGRGDAKIYSIVKTVEQGSDS